MVTTRSAAAPPTDEPSQTAAESPDKSQRGRTRSRAKAAKMSPQKKTESKTLSKAKRRDRKETESPQLRNKTMAIRLKHSREDIHADSAPDDPSSSDIINKQASVKGTKQNNSRIDETEGETLPTSMETPREIAEASQKRREMIERERLAREAREKEEEILCEQRQRQMMLFIASTRKPSHEGQERHVLPSHEGYYQKHGWYIWEDEIILDMIRKVKSPNIKVLAKQFPWRTVAEVEQRVMDLRARMKLKFETQGRQPPKWCYN